MLSGRTALVTGSTSGIGLTIAQSLAAAGANIVIWLRRCQSHRGGEVQACPRLECRCGLQPADMTHPADIEAMMTLAAKEFGHVDILVNNAGIQHVDPIEDFPTAKWDAIIAITLTAAFHTTRLAVPAMKKKKWGRIINIASAHALVASPFKSAYVSAKHGLAGLTKTVALEVATDGITVNAICPGYVMTPLVEHQIPEQAKARGISEEAVVHDVILDAQPTKRFVTVAEIASLVAYLCGDDAKSITGSMLSIDGGWTAH
jgi:3-hydroxybutyrate dehydrogenase